MVRSLYKVSLVGLAACLIAMEWYVHETFEHTSFLKQFIY